jgi:hypothetical protein
MDKGSVCGKDRSLPSDSPFKIGATETIISATIMNDGTGPSGRKVILVYLRPPSHAARVRRH